MAAPNLRVSGPDGSPLDFVLRDGRLTVGSSDGCDVVVRGEGVLEEHFVAVAANDGLTVRTTAGAQVVVDGQPASGDVPLSPGSSLRLGEYSFAIAPDEAPRQLGRYAILGVIAQGAMGVVYEAEQAPLGRRVALKVLHPSVLGSQQAHEAMVREWQGLAAIDHPGVVPILDAGVIEDEPYLAMRLLTGGSLAKLIARRGRLQPDDAVGILIGTADALDAVHEAGMVHRDVKPSNILLASPGSRQAFLVDFGIAVSGGAGRVAGTRGYIAPEVALGNPAGARSDQFALALVLYQALTGDRLGATGARGKGSEYDISEGLRSLAAEHGTTIVRVIERGLRPNPEERYGSCRELMEDAGRALGAAVRPAAAQSQSLTVVGTQTFTSATSGVSASASRGSVELRGSGGSQPRVSSRAKKSGVVLVLAAAIIGTLVYLARPQIPTAPLSFTGTAKPFEVRLSWAAPSNGVAVDRYVIQRGTSEVATVEGEGPLTWADNKAEPGKSYDYTLRAESEDGASPPTTTLVAVPELAPNAVQLDGEFQLDLQETSNYGYVSYSGEDRTLYLTADWQCARLQPCQSISFSIDLRLSESPAPVLGTLSWSNGAWSGSVTTYGWTRCPVGPMRSTVLITLVTEREDIDLSARLVRATSLSVAMTVTTPSTYDCRGSGSELAGSGRRLSA